MLASNNVDEDKDFKSQVSDGLLQVFLIVSDLLLVPPPKDQVSRKPPYSPSGAVCVQ